MKIDVLKVVGQDIGSCREEEIVFSNRRITSKGTKTCVSVNYHTKCTLNICLTRQQLEVCVVEWR